MKKIPCVAALVLAAFGLRAEDPETQKVVFENDLVRVLDIRVPPGVFEPKHSHPRGVTIALSDYDNETKSIPDGKVNRGHTKFAEVKFVEPVTHEARNTGTVLQHVIRIELKKDAPANPAKPDALDGPVVCKDTQKILFENAYVRAIEDRLPAGGFSPKHSHQRGLLVILNDFDAEAKPFPSGKVARTHYTKGSVAWNDAQMHEVKNVGKTELYAVRIEVK